MNSLTTKLVMFTAVPALIPPLTMIGMGMSPSPTLLIAGGVGLVSAVGLACGFVRLLSRHISPLTAALGQLNAGQLEARAPVTSQDELGQVASALNQLLDNTLPRLQAQETHLLEHTAALDQLATSMQQVSEHATVYATEATQVLDHARQGSNAMQHTMQSMQRAQIQTKDTVKRIKHLHEHTREVNELAQRIGDLAERTSILALNVSVQAAHAGDMGQGFALLAAEVEHLAGGAADASQRIAYTLNTIGCETDEVVQAIEVNTSDMEQSVQAAHHVGQTLGDIDGVSTHLTDLVQSIAAVTKQQKRAQNTAQMMSGRASEGRQQAKSSPLATASRV